MNGWRKLAALLLALVLLGGCALPAALTTGPPSDGSGEAGPAPPAPPADGYVAADADGRLSGPADEYAAASGAADAEPLEATFMAVGDIMMHAPQLPGAYDKRDKRYDFRPFFKYVKPILAQGDWVMANLETPLSDDGDYTGYPLFNAPHELAEALADAGFNIVTTANNHALDRGAKGALRTLDFLERQGLTTKGTYRSEEEARLPVMIEANGIRMGLLAYTYGTNGIPLPQDRPYLVSMIDEAKMEDDIRRLRGEGADFIAIALHFGIEYRPQPSDGQKRLARKLIAAGADIVAGSHPHVVQPYEVVEAPDGHGGARKGVIVYSLGNFISNQRDELKDYGIILKIRIRKQPATGEVDVRSITPIVTWVHRYRVNGHYQYRIIPVEQALASRANPLLKEADYKRLEQHLRQLDKRLSSLGADEALAR